jgi:hypothetical protein
LSIANLVSVVESIRSANKSASKDKIAALVAAELSLKKLRSVYAGSSYTVRFAEAKGNTFSNTVVSLSTIKPHDSKPFIIILLRPDSTEFFLANTTFLKKVSHTSQKLRVDNVKGSILGHDIIRNYEGMQNAPDNFEKLFCIHQEFTWEENLTRLVEATGNIVPTGKRFEPTADQVENILRAPKTAKQLSSSYKYEQLKAEIAGIVAEKKNQILAVAEIDNVNLRGNQIEQLITGGINEHNLADIVRETDGIEVSLEIKTKLMERSSSPKAYNVDKALMNLARGKTAIVFCFIGITLETNEVTSTLISILDRTMLAATRIQFHWAGRNSRGVTQLTGEFSQVFAKDYKELIDEAEAEAYLKRLLEL